jgi:uncharacterized membrane protein
MAIRSTVAGNLRLWMEFGITVLVLVASFIVLIAPTADIVNQGAYQLITLALGYWFGRGSAVVQERRARDREGD